MPLTKDDKGKVPAVVTDGVQVPIGQKMVEKWQNCRRQRSMVVSKVLPRQGELFGVMVGGVQQVTY